MKTRYKIRNIHTGLYSSGGLSPTFEKEGKTWNGKGNLKLHMHLFDGKKSYNGIPFIDLEVVTFEMVETGAFFLSKDFVFND